MTAVADLPRAEGSGRNARRAGAFASFERIVSRRYLVVRKANLGFVSVIPLFCILGIMVGVATLIVVMSVINGFRHDVLESIVSVNGHVYVEKIGEPMTEYADLAARLKKVPGVTAAIPMVEGVVGLFGNNRQAGGWMRGIGGKDLRQLPGVMGHVVQGTLADFDQSGGIVIGQPLADTLHVKLGDNVTVFSARGLATPFGVLPRTKPYRLVATFKVGLTEIDDKIFFMPLHEAQVFFGRENDANVVETFVDTPDDMPAVLRGISAAVAGEPISITDWRNRNQSLAEFYDTQRNAMMLVLSLIIVVAVFNIVAGMVTLVTVKRQDIAVLRTMGATRGAIMRIFVLAGAWIGVIGTALGLAIGLLIAANVDSIRLVIEKFLGVHLLPPELYMLSHLPSIIQPWDIAEVCVIAFVLAMAATLYPSWSAASLDPVEVLRVA